ncbi:MAG: ribosomal L7Ae/L30e/S12e/Gadd45 family protein [Clostridia bacterium]|nr:ribosomal L7Ae/L30e/S12e/Gadd45 family protein [Clostridia bacterium]
MEKDKRIFGLLGIAMKAGKIAFGTESVIESIEKGKAVFVLISEDASSKSKENMKFLCEKNNVKIVEYGTIENISKSIGKQNKSVICIKDKNLGEEIYKIICGGEAIG